MTAADNRCSHQCEIAVVFIMVICIEMYREYETEQRGLNPLSLSRQAPIDAWPLICAQLQMVGSMILGGGLGNDGACHSLCKAISHTLAQARREIFNGLCALCGKFTFDRAMEVVRAAQKLFLRVRDAPSAGKQSKEQLTGAGWGSKRQKVLNKTDPPAEGKL